MSDNHAARACAIILALFLADGVKAEVGDAPALLEAPVSAEAPVSVPKVEPAAPPKGDNVAPSANAAAPATAEDPETQRLRGVLASLQPQTGDISIQDAKATLRLAKNYYFLSPEDSRKVIVDLWGNAPDAADGVLGMIFPVGKSPLESWGAVVTYEFAGYVSDKDAKDIKPDKLLTQMREGESEHNRQLADQGYATMRVAGWAEPPSYNAAHKYAVWARELEISDSKVHGLNYDIRLLGRYGYLSLNMVASMPELQEVRDAADGVVAAAKFNNGATYAEFDPKIDKKAEYGVAGLVAAGLGLAAAKKFGLLAVILAFGKKAIVLVVAAFAALAGGVRKMFGKKDEPEA